jgi:hypothetical protein
MSKELKLSKEGIELANQVGKELAELVAKQLSEREEMALIEQETLKLERNRGRFLPVIPNMLIPDDDEIRLPCPAVHPKQRKASKCRNCEHFDGVFQHTFPTPRTGLPVPKLHWTEQYGIRCRYPVERLCLRLEIEK